MLRLDQTCCSLNAHNQAPSNLGVQGAAVPCLLDTENAADPGHNLMGRWVGRLIQIDEARPRTKISGQIDGNDLTEEKLYRWKKQNQLSDVFKG